MKKYFFVLGMTLCMCIAAIAQKSTVFIKNDAAINGYDAVAYFTESKPVKGSKQLSYRWMDADWYFSSRQNLDLFKATPDKYAPQYGGYCAYGCSRGYKASTEPDAWTIVNNKLYLNYNTDVQETWLKDKANFIQKADKNWPSVKAKE
jgi:YHS domain-containing protein